MSTKSVKSHMRKSKSGKPCKVRQHIKIVGKKRKVRITKGSYDRTATPLK